MPGYPDWVWRRPPAQDGEWYQRFQDQAVDIDGPDLDKVRAAAEAAGVWVALGITERTSSGTLYNAVVYIDDRGEVAGLHRKLVPTGAERTVWANGQDPMLTVVDIGGVKVGSLICWENYMPLARAALYEKGIDVLLAPDVGQQRRMGADAAPHRQRGQGVRRRRHRVHPRLRRTDRPPGCRGALRRSPTHRCRTGTAPSWPPAARCSKARSLGEAGTVTATLDLDRIAAGRRAFDPIGHYARPDVLTLTDNTNGDRHD